MSEGNETQYSRTRDAILKRLYSRYVDEHELVAFTKEDFEEILEEDPINIGDSRTVNKYWDKLLRMKYIQMVNKASAKLTQKGIKQGGRIDPLEEGKKIEVVDLRAGELMTR